MCGHPRGTPSYAECLVAPRSPIRHIIMLPTKYGTDKTNSRLQFFKIVGQSSLPWPPFILIIWNIELHYAESALLWVFTEANILQKKQILLTYLLLSTNFEKSLKVHEWKNICCWLRTIKTCLVFRKQYNNKQKLRKARPIYCPQLDGLQLERY